jgi:eukaryotic-like serine/threonine-protein kinase
MRLGRYEVFGPFATGGMAAIHFGKLNAPGGFRRLVAIKVPHAALVRDADFRAMFLDEARIVSRIQSPHVVATLDVLEEGETLYQVMEYANGPSLASVLRTLNEREERVPIPIVVAIVVDVLEGLHAAHEAKDDRGTPLNVVHRDVSPQNVVLNDDGVAKVIDFGIASAAGKLHLTQPGDVRGKVSYMAPEQIEGRPADRRVDVYAVGVVLYQLLTGQRPFVAEDTATTAMQHLLGPAPDPREKRPEVSDELGAIVGRALEKKPSDRFPTARAMADALIATSPARASVREVADWLTETSSDFFAERRALIAALPSSPDEVEVAPTQVPIAEEISTRVVRKRNPLAALLVAGLLLVGAFIAIAFQWRSHDSQPVIASQTATIMPTVSVAPMPTPSVVALPIPSATVDVVASVAPIPTHARVSAVRPDAAVKPVESSTASAPSARPCCAGSLRILLSNCTDNCPPGT